MELVTPPPTSSVQMEITMEKMKGNRNCGVVLFFF